MSTSEFYGKQSVLNITIWIEFKKPVVSTFIIHLNPMGIISKNYKKRIKFIRIAFNFFVILFT
jgi:hypothetical protein